MKNSNTSTSFGLLFSTTAALVSPAHEAMVRKPLYDAVPPLGIRPAVGMLLGGTLRRIDAWRRRREQRQSLKRLDDHLLRDIGLERQDVLDELNKPFWRP